MHNIIVRNFGPVGNLELEIKDFTIFFGPQASGKSTISKLIYFFKTVRDEIYSSSIEFIEIDRRNMNITITKKKLASKMTHLFGPHIKHDNYYLQYNYKEGYTITITNEGGVPFFDISFHLRKDIERTTNFVREYKIRKQTSKGDKFSRLIGVMGDKTFLTNLRDRLNETFNDQHEILYIPAGRSLIAALSNKLNLLFKLTEQDWNVDYLTKVFSEKILDTRGYFDQNLEEIIEGKRGAALNRIKEAVSIIQSILGGTYKYEEDRDKLFLDDNKYLSLNYASSGQQESLWILYLILYYIIEEKECFMVIEEPEAHLFPDAQSEILKMISILVNGNRNQCIVTTHSPYILSSLNNHLYGHYLAVEYNQRDFVDARFSLNTLVDPNEVNAFFITNGQLNDILDKETMLLSGELLDRVSEKNNEHYETLFKREMELKYGDNEFSDADM